jgi:fengycin family lipopeptide synthetase D
MNSLVTRLRKLHIELGLVDNKLKINAPEGVMTGELLKEIKEQKEYLIEYIKGVARQKKNTVIKQAEEKEYYPLSSAQKRLYILYSFERNSLAYNETQVVRLDGKLNRTRLEAAFGGLIARHESLRTTFDVIDNEPVQIIGRQVDCPVSYFQAADKGIGEIIKEFVQPFDLGKGPLFRVAVIDNTDQEHVLVVDMHHIITDAMSEGVLIHDFMALYNEQPLPDLKLQYKDYANWQQGKIRQQEIAGQKDFWMRGFQEPVAPLVLPADYPRPLVKGRGGDRLSFGIGVEETARLKEIAAGEGASTFMLLLALYNVLLGRLSNQEDIVCGIPMADRQHPGLENLIGIFINTLALRNYPKGSLSFQQFLSDVKKNALACFDNQAYPYETLIDDLKIVRDTGRNPLFDVWFIYQNYEKIRLDTHGLSIQEYDKGPRESKFDMILEAYEWDNRFHFNLTYSTDIFKKERVEQFIDSFRNIIKAIVQDVTIKIGAIELVAAGTVQGLNKYAGAIVGQGELIPASFHQERLWFIDKFESGYLYKAGPVYHNIPLLIDWQGEVDAGLLQQSIQAVIQQHKVLRTRIINIEERPFQQIDEVQEFVLREVQAAGAEREALIKQEINEPFELDRLLHRGILIKAGEGQYKLLLVWHHIIVDRYSVGQLLQEILAIYKANLQQEAVEKCDAVTSYAGFSLWQQEALLLENMYLLSYWKQQLGNKLKALELPTDRTRAAIHIYTGAAVPVQIPAGVVEGIRAYVQHTGMDTNLFLMGVFNVLLYKYCRHAEIVIGTSADNRRDDMVANLVGPVASLIVLKTMVLAEVDFLTYLNTLKEVYEGGMKHQAMPFDKLVKELAPEKDMSRTALFDVLFQYEETRPVPPTLEGVQLEVIETNLGYGKYDLHLFLQGKGDQVCGEMVYNADYFDKATMEGMMGHYGELIKNILLQPGTPLGAIEMTGMAEKEDLLNGLNNLQVDYPRQKTITQLFTEQVQRTPDRIALQYLDETITYAALDRWSTHLALQLRERGVKANDVVGLLTGRSIGTVVGMLAILKAGGAYLPMDVDYPRERIDYLIEDSGMTILLASRDLQMQVSPMVTVLLIEATAGLTEEVVINHINQASDLCYIIYTSGTTGRPKGVMIEHRNVVRLLFNEQFQFDFDQDDVWTMFHSHCFDFSVWEIYGALLFGGKVIIIPKAIARDTKAYLDILVKEQVTILNQTPSAFYNLVQAILAQPGAKLSLREVIFGGEALSPARLKDWRVLYPDVKLVNMFGITETTVHVTYKEIGDEEIEGNISNVGKPIPTLSVYLFDEYMKPVPRGITGELYVGGEGVARGYLNNAELTGKKFIVNPYNAQERLYRTGDLARVLRSGDIEYIGRIDHQVQLRGFRIELGEIESHLNRFAGVKESVVVARGAADDQYLAAYYVATDEQDTAELRRFLMEKLPDYMVPTHFMRLEKMPLTGNGKLDKQALPDREITAGSEYIGPSNETEEKLVEIWSEVLKLDKELIPVNKSFFELGGHSLRATVLVNKIGAALQVEVPLKEVFKNQDILSLSSYIRAAQKAQYTSIQPAAEKVFYALSASQRRLYFLYEFDKMSLAYNLPQVVRLKGALDRQRLEDAFQQLIARHESLRTSFALINGQPVQKVAEQANIVIEYCKAGEAEVQGIVKGFIRPFDLGIPMLLRAGIIETGPDHFLLMVDLHHIITDGVSQSILIRELAACYRGERLPPLRLQYKDYAEWQWGAGYQQTVAQQKSCWKEMLSGQTTLELATDFARPALKGYAGSRINFEIGAVETAGLQALAQKEGTTLFMVMLAVYNILLSKLSHAEDIIIGTPVAGRQHADLENMMGMFINTLPLRNYPTGDLSFRDFLATVRDRTLACFDNQSYPYEALIDELNVPRDTSRNPLFDVMFFFQNFEMVQPDMPGLQLTAYEVEETVSKFDLTLIASEKDGQLACSFEYSTELFRASTIERYAVYFKQVILDILADTDTQLKDISLLGAAEKNTLLQDFNDTRAIYPSSASLVSLFDEQVARTPDAVAVVYGREEMRYRTLQEKSELVAAHLLQLGLQKGGLVGLLVDRGPWLLPCLLGILKAGGAYVPIDPFYPAQRIQYVLQDSGVGLVLTTLEVAEELQTSARFVDVRSLTDLPVSELPNIESDALAYMIYTSGSTGQPKGVMISHRNVVNFVYGVRERISFAGGSRMLCLTTVSFDIFVLETMLPLLSGMTVVLAGAGDQKDPLALLELIKEAGVDFMQITPSHLKLLLDSAGAVSVLSSLKVLMAGGEGLPVWLLEELRNKLKGRIYNMYGPTETTVWSTIADLTESGVVHIGRPIANTSIRILDRYGKLVPMGVAGELCIGGDGLSRGYWQREKLTKERFIDDPYEEGQRLYRTGDAGRWQADGTLVCGGRLDDQVKIRGHRIEPGEIETVLNGVEGINRSVVVAVERAGEKLLAAYYEGAAELGAGALRASLSGRLPDYMLPSYFVWLERLPLTPNGKLNRRELPDPVEKGIGGGDYIAPANSTEEQLVELWSEVLKLDKGSISTDKSFFELGGHSLSAMVVSAQIQQTFNVKIQLANFFQQPTVRDLGKRILITGLTKKTNQSAVKVTI